MGVDIAAQDRGIFLTVASSLLLSFHFPDVLWAISLEQDPVINQAHNNINAEVSCNVMVRGHLHLLALSPPGKAPEEVAAFPSLRLCPHWGNSHLHREKSQCLHKKTPVSC